jgi:segregation and condensation protein A
VVFEQLTPLGELHVRWIGGADAGPELPDDGEYA